MTPSLSNPVALLRSARGVAPDERLAAAKGFASKRLKPLARQAKRRMITGQIRLVELGLDVESANRYFWNGPGRNPVWFDVQSRLERLQQRSPSTVEQFVHLGLANLHDPTTLFGFALHPSSTEYTRGWLRDHALPLTPPIVRTLQSNRLLGGALVGAGSLVLPNDEATRLAFSVADLYQLPDNRMFQMQDSFGTRLHGAGDRARLGTPCEHRLVIVDRPDDLAMLALLLPGAEHCTVIALGDTFGRADLAPHAPWLDGTVVNVEHIRSRITRFSSEYIDLHEATAAVAESFCDQIMAIPGLALPADKPYLDVEAADQLFFQALKIRAVETLIADSGFDHIVLALGNQRAGNEFFRLLESVDGLLDDERLELVSISRSTSIRSDFWSQVQQLTKPDHGWTAPVRQVPAELVHRKFHEDARRSAESLPVFEPSDRKHVVFVTANSPAYNDSSAAYADHLAHVADVQIVHMGRNATELVGHLHQLGADHIGLSFLAPTAGRFAAMADLVMTAVEPSDPAAGTDSGTVAERAAAAALRATRRRLVEETMLPAVSRLRSVDHWFASMDSAGCLPDLVVLTPSRTVAVASVAPAARRHRVPSLVLEPHAQDANYCRYLKITSDYYGVMSEYFRDQAIAGFGTGPDRTVVVGSPRQVAPAGYDPEVARATARREYSERHGVEFPDGVPHIVYFCQPSDWRHVSTTWGHVLEAAHRTGARVLLKTHPEETPTRTQGYLQLAARQGHADRVVLLDCDAAAAIALADIAATAYSAAGIDAAVRQTPVVCVTDGDVRYPVDLPAILGAPLARSADELTDVIVDLMDRPEYRHQVARSLLDREPQFVDGPEERLQTLVATIVGLGEAAIRPADELPGRLFLDGPHPRFPV